MVASSPIRRTIYGRTGGALSGLTVLSPRTAIGFDKLADTVNLDAQTGGGTILMQQDGVAILNAAGTTFVDMAIPAYVGDVEVSIRAVCTAVGATQTLDGAIYTGIANAFGSRLNGGVGVFSAASAPLWLVGGANGPARMYLPNTSVIGSFARISVVSSAAGANTYSYSVRVVARGPSA